LPVEVMGRVDPVLGEPGQALAFEGRDERV
jgi:hypothetical protein